jgi:hypothetical protein
MIQAPGEKTSFFVCRQLNILIAYYVIELYVIGNCDIEY